MSKKSLPASRKARGSFLQVPTVQHLTHARNQRAELKLVEHLERFRSVGALLPCFLRQFKLYRRVATNLRQHLAEDRIFFIVGNQLCVAGLNTGFFCLLLPSLFFY